MAVGLPALLFRQNRRNAGTAFDIDADSGIQRVVVIHFCTMRVDDFGCYGGFVDTPNVDALAARGMRYTNAVTCFPMTPPSVATFMTGRYPQHHGVYNPHGMLTPEQVTLAEILRRNGFSTAGFSSNPIMANLVSSDKQPGFDQGFDIFQFYYMRSSSDDPPLCETITRRAIDFIRSHRDDRFFLWLLHADAHTPYNPPPPYDTMYVDHPDLVHMKDEKAEGEVVGYCGPESLGPCECIARHKGEVTLTDKWVGELVAELDGMDGRTLIVVLADHGESFGDGGVWYNHGPNIRYPCIDVPVIIVCPDRVPVGVSDALVGNADLAPTILELVGLPPAAIETDGMSLVPTFTEPDPWPNRVIPLLTEWPNAKWRGMRSSRYCFQALYPHDGLEPELIHLYDHRSDPRESIDIAHQLEPVTQQFAAATHATFFPADPDAVAPAMVLPETDELRDRLRSLGYLK